jgi:site-specific recombinase XerC
MSALAPTLQAFFTDRLIKQRNASPHTIAAYRDTWRLLLSYASERRGVAPSVLDLADLDVPLIGGFLDHLETGRGNSIRTRNARLECVKFSGHLVGDFCYAAVAAWWNCVSASAGVR